MRRRLSRGGALLLALLFLSGCWDQREIEARSIVLSAGVDRCKQETPDCKVVISRQIAIPGRIPLGTSGGAPGPSPVVVLATPGVDGPDSAAKAQAQVNHELYFAQNRVMVFSEALCRGGITDWIAYVRRLPEVHRLIWVAVTEGDALEVLQARPDLEQVPAIFLNDMLQDAVRRGAIPDATFGDFLVRLSNPGDEPVAPLIRMNGDKPELTGLAVFRDTTMVGKLSPTETATYLLLRGHRAASEVLHLDLGEEGFADLKAYGRGVRYQLRWDGQRVWVRVRATLETDLMELSPGLSSQDPETLARLEREAARLVSDRAGSLTEKLQREIQSDVLGVGERVRSALPAAWRQIPDWQTAFGEAHITFEMKVYIRRTGAAAD